jgi:uncharacterized RDD family membrane protein YckC
MKCPKCGYLGFEQVERCRNCGYEFSLANTASDVDLALRARTGDTPPLQELSFLKEPSASAPMPASDLPLFAPAGADDEPLITRPSPPRPPLSVRRDAEPPRLRSEPRAQSFELAFDVDPSDAPAAASVVQVDSESRTDAHESDVPAALSSSASGASSSAAPTAPPAIPIVLPAAAASPEAAASTLATEQRFHHASLVARLFGMVIDLVVLALVDVTVVYFTMQLCGITFFELGILPKAPLLAFIVLQNGGYLVGFTAGGQTLGKMVMGIRVVSAEEAEPIGVGRAFERTLLWAILAAPAGLGLLTALFSSDHRGLHDRLAGTRVVRASA